MTKKESNVGIIITSTILIFFFFVSLYTLNWKFLIGASGAFSMLFYYTANRLKHVSGKH